MTSMLCVQQSGGLVQQHQKGSVEEILRDSANHAIFAKYFPTDKIRPMFFDKRPYSTPNLQVDHGNIDRQRLMGHSMKLQAWLNEKSVKLMQEKSDAEAKPVKEVYNSVLNREENFVKDLHDFCDNHDYLNQRKKEILHKTWSDRVYEPIRKVIVEQMDNENYKDYKKRKDQLYREYIEHVNKKGHVFRDDYDPSEYYALGLHANRPTVVEGLQGNIGQLKDPTLLQSRNRDKEDQIKIKCSSGETYRGASLDKVRLPTLPLNPQGRHGTENDTWIAMQLSDIESDVRQASRRRMVGNNLRSEINFGNWSQQKFSQEVTDSEIGIQKRRHCQQPPFTSPKAVARSRKVLPAAKESYRSKTLPFYRRYDNIDYDCPYGTDFEAPETKEEETPQIRDDPMAPLNQAEIVF